MSHPSFIIATTKSWNISLANEMKLSSNYGQIHVITQKEQLNIDLLNEVQPNYVFFPHWSWIIPDEIINNFRCVIFHMTDLPFGRGGSPLQNLIERGIEETKICAVKATGEIDAGDVYLRHPLSLHGTAEEIFKRAANIIFYEMIPYILNENPIPVPQEGTVTLFKRRTPDMSELTPDMSLEKCYDYIRMLDAEDYPKAFLRYGNFNLQFSRPKLTSNGIVADVLIKEVEADE